MVRDDHVDVPDHHRLPEQLLVVLVSDWWTTLVLGGSWRDLCRAEVEVVVAGLHCQLETLSSSSSDQRQGGGGREMDVVTLTLTQHCFPSLSGGSVSCVS